MFKPGTLGPFWGLTLLCCWTAENTAGSSLPTEVTINQEAGRGGWLVVTLRLESGGELPFVLDTGSSGTVFDKSLEPQLGPSLGTAAVQSCGVERTVNVYAAPKVYLGGAPLVLPRAGILTDDLKQLRWKTSPSRPPPTCLPRLTNCHWVMPVPK
jgi:hypothetical protein